MAFSVFQAGSTLYGMDQRGNTVALTLPVGVKLDPTQQARFAMMGNYAIMVNSPNRPITVDANLNVRVLTPDPPAAKPTVSAVAGGTLSGTFRVRETFVMFDAFGRLIAESDFGPSSDTVSPAAQYLKSTLNISGDRVSARRLYRTTDGTAVYFQWIDADGNVTTSIQDDLSDAGLATFSAPSLGTPPNLYMIAEFKSRLYGVGKGDRNTVYYTEVGAPYAWPSDNTIAVPRLGSDVRGATGLLRRRDALGLGRSNGLYQIHGTDDTTLGVTNISEFSGVESIDSIQVWKDVAFFVWKDGIYTWGPNGVTNVSDDKVRKWFTSNSTFNLERLQYSFGIIDPLRHKYRLYLASAGSNTEDSWIEYDFNEGKFWGPHSSHAMNPSTAFMMSTDSGAVIPLVGGTDGYVRIDRKKRVDDTATPIDFDVVTARQDFMMPQHEKMFGTLAVSNKPNPDGGTLTVQSTVGDPDQPREAVTSDPEDVDLSESYTRLSRIGVGKAMKIRFRNNNINEDVLLRGYEVDPVSVLGKR